MAVVSPVESLLEFFAPVSEAIGTIRVCQGYEGALALWRAQIGRVVAVYNSGIQAEIQPQQWFYEETLAVVTGTCSGCTAGRMTRKQLPLPGVLST